MAYSAEEAKRDQEQYGSMGIGTGYEFYQHWIKDTYPRVILILLRTSDAILRRFLRGQFREQWPVWRCHHERADSGCRTTLPHHSKPYARVLTGGSTGGWESLALQVYHPKFFGGTWTMYPDPIDFRRYDLVNIDEDDNAFYQPGHEWLSPERYFQRSPDGQPQVTVRQLSQLEAVLGSHGRSGQQLDIWQAVYGPVGDDGYPIPIWDKATGKIDHSVASYMRDHGYDLRYYIETNWPKIGPDLVGKLHLTAGDMDHYYLNLATYLLEDFLKNNDESILRRIVHLRPPHEGPRLAGHLQGGLDSDDRRLGRSAHHCWRGRDALALSVTRPLTPSGRYTPWPTRKRSASFQRTTMPESSPASSPT